MQKESEGVAQERQVWHGEACRQAKDAEVSSIRHSSTRLKASLLQCREAGGGMKVITGWVDHDLSQTATNRGRPSQVQRLAADIPEWYRYSQFVQRRNGVWKLLKGLNGRPRKGRECSLVCCDVFDEWIWSL